MDRRMVLSFMSFSLLASLATAREAPRVRLPGLLPALYVFGSSMVDSGENAVAMPLRSKAEFSPYGLDYFSAPVGRWSNGRTFMDLITQKLGYGMLSPFLKSVGGDFSHGVNFASAGSTATNSTAAGDDSGGLFALLVQVDQFREFQAEVGSFYQGSYIQSQLKQHFSDSVYFIETAHNDYILSAFQTEDFNPLTLVTVTIAAMRRALQALYYSGAKSFIVMNVTPLGCAPSILSNPYGTTSYDEYGCKVDYLNLVTMHNEHLEALLSELRVQFPSGEWILFDAYSIMLDGYQNPSKYGIKYPLQACCGVGGKYNFMKDVECGSGKVLINETLTEAKRCQNPMLHVIWDSLHPTKSFSHYIANGVLNGISLTPTFNIKERLQPMKDPKIIF